MVRYDTVTSLTTPRLHYEQPHVLAKLLHFDSVWLVKTGVAAVGLGIWIIWSIFTTAIGDCAIYSEMTE